MTFAALFAAGISFTVAWSIARYRDLAGRSSFVLLMLVIGGWSLLSGLQLLTRDLATHVTLAQLQTIPTSGAPLLWFLIVRRVAGRPALGREAIALMMAVPALTVGLAWTNAWHGLVWRQIATLGGAIVYQPGLWLWWAVAYSYCLLAMAAIVLVRTVMRTPPAFRLQLHSLLVAGGLPWAANVLYLSGAIPAPALDPTPLAFGVTGPLILWGLTHYRLLDTTPVAYDTLIDQLDDGVIILDHQRRVVGLNPAAAQLSGLTGEAVGAPLDRALPALAETVAATADGPRVIEPFGPRGVSVEVRQTRLAGPRAGARGWLIVLRDITPQQALARQVREERDFALQVMQTMGEGLTVTDSARRFTFVNDAYARLFGYRPTDLLGRTPSEVTVEEDRTTLQAAHNLRRAGQSNTYLSRLRRANGEIAVVQITGTPRLVNGQYAGSIAVVTDQTERLAQEAALREAEQTLRSFFDSAGVMMGIVELGDDDIRHIDANHATATFFGTTAAALAGRWTSELGIPQPTIRQWLEAYRASERSGQPTRFESVYTMPAGPCWLTATVACIGPAAAGPTRYSYVATDITAHKQLEQELRVSQLNLAVANAELAALARTDALTGLHNRATFDKRIADEVARLAHAPAPLSLLLLDIDHFKACNDTYGHLVGDRILRRVAQIIGEQVGEAGMVARYGGEEFAVLLPGAAGPAAGAVAEAVRRSIEGAPWQERGITISIGVATAPPVSGAQLVAWADAALYQAKSRGRNRVCHYDDARVEPAV